MAVFRFATPTPNRDSSPPAGDLVAACLGVFEENTAKRLGTPEGFRSHERALTVHQHLSQAPGNHTATPNKDGSALHDDASAAKHNGMMALKFNSGCTPYTTMKAKPDKPPAKQVSEAPKDSVEFDGIWHRVQEPAALYALTQHFHLGVIEECGLGLSSPGKAGEGLALPPLASVPAGRLRTTRNPSTAKLETVAVESVSPFVWSDAEALFLREHPPPCGDVPAWAIPRLQFELHLEDIEWANYVSASTTRGMHIFRVQRDESYVAKLLRVVAKFYAAYTKAGAPPEENFFWGDKDYMDWIDHTLRLAQGVEAPEVVLQMRRPSGREPFFLDKELPDGDQTDADEQE